MTNTKQGAQTQRNIEMLIYHIEHVRLHEHPNRNLVQQPAQKMRGSRMVNVTWR